MAPLTRSKSKLIEQKLKEMNLEIKRKYPTEVYDVDAFNKIARQFEEDNIQNVPPKKRSVKNKSMSMKLSESAFFDKRELEGLDAFPAPVVDATYKSDCKILKTAFRTGRFDKIDSHLTERIFFRNLEYLKAISDGKLFSAKHQEYLAYNGNHRHMSYASGTIILGGDNLGVLMRLCSRNLVNDPDDWHEQRAKINYFMLVAIPEMLTKLLMDLYKISKPQAVDKKLEIGIRVTQKNPWMS